MGGRERERERGGRESEERVERGKSQGEIENYKLRGKTETNNQKEWESSVRYSDNKRVKK